MKSSMKKPIWNFLNHTKLISKHKEPIEDIFKKGEREGEGGVQPL